MYNLPFSPADLVFSKLTPICFSKNMLVYSPYLLCCLPVGPQVTQNVTVIAHKFVHIHFVGVT